MKKTALFISLLLLSKIVYAYGFKMDEINKIHKVILQDTLTVTQLAQGLTFEDSDRNYADEIYMVGSSVISELGHFSNLGLLYGDMVNSVDKAKVRARISTNKSIFIKECALNIEYLNTNLSPIKNTAIVSAGENLRNHVQEACDLVKEWK